MPSQQELAPGDSMAAHTRRRRPRLPAEATAVAAAFALAYPWLLPPIQAVGSAGDDGVYVALGRALATGQGYRSIYAAGAPAHVKFPPFLPFLYALPWSLGATLQDIAVLARGLNDLALAMAVGLLWWLARARLEIGRTAAAVLVVGPLFLDSALQYAGLALSEPYFILGWAFALVLATRVRRADREDGDVTRRNARWAGAASGAAVGAVLGVAVLVRTQAVALLPAFWLALVLARARRPALLASIVAALLPPLAWLAVRTALTGGAAAAGVETGYVGDLGGAGPQMLVLLRGVPEHLRLYVSVFAPYLAWWPRVGGMLVGLYLALALLGLARLRRRQPELVLSVVATALLIALWPYTTDRFVLSLLPFTGLAAAFWLETELAGRRPTLRVAILVVGLLVAGAAAARQVYIRRMGARAARDDRPAEFWTPSYTIPAVSRYIRDASAWVAAHPASGTPVVAAWPEGIFLLTGRPTVNLEPAESALRRSVHADSGRYLARSVVRTGAKAVIVWDGGSASERETAAVLRACPAALHPAGQVAPYGYPRFFVTGDLDCLRRLAAAGDVAPP